MAYEQAQKCVESSRKETEREMGSGEGRDTDQGERQARGGQASWVRTTMKWEEAPR